MMYKKVLYSYIRKHTANTQDALDILQECFVKLIMYQDRIQKEKVKPWLFTVARHLIIALWKRSRKKNLLETPYEDLSDHAMMHMKSYDTPYERLSQKERLSLLEASLDQLSTKDRELIILRYNSHLSYQEIATITGRSLSDIKVKLHRLRETLAKMVNQNPPLNKVIS